MKDTPLVLDAEGKSTSWMIGVVNAGQNFSAVVWNLVPKSSV